MKSEGNKPVSGRRAARLAAVQALYQIELGGEPAELVMEEFIAHRLGRIIEDIDVGQVDVGLFKDIALGVSGRLSDINLAIETCLDKDRELDRLEAIMRALLRAAAFELMLRPDVPAKVVINEYLEVAHAFFSGNEPGFANGVLDRLTRRLRPNEMVERTGGKAQQPR